MGVHNNTPLRLGLVRLGTVRDTRDSTVCQTPELDSAGDMCDWTV